MPPMSSRAKMIVVKTDPTITTNITGLRSWWRGSSLRTASRTARFTIGGANSGRRRVPWECVVILEQPPRTHPQVLDDRAERQGRKEGEGTDDQDYADQQYREERTGDGERPGRVGDNALPVSYTHLRAHETRHDLVCRLLL